MAEIEAPAANRVRETKAQRAERLKREKNPWEHLAELRDYARRGFHAIPAEWIGTYLRWWGVYTQGDGAGVLGGQNGEGRAAPYFMARVRVTNGLLTARQLRAIADAAERYARGVADITVRQNIQFHWIEAEALPELLDVLWSAGLTTQGSCGDDTRNVTGCPLAGLDAAELCDASPLARELTHALVGRADFYNLPRKFKISVTGCSSWCTYPEINDVGLTAVRRHRGGKEEVGFSLRVGGGLSAEPHLAQRLDAFVRWEQVVPVARAVAEIFRDSEMLRQNRKRARLKYLFLEHGWTAQSFLHELNERLGFQLDPAEPDNPPQDVFRDHIGVHPQKQHGLSYVGASVLRGRITPQQMRLAADLSERFADGHLRTTAMQNLLIANVRDAEAVGVAQDLQDAGLQTDASPFRRGAVACTGTEFCKLAITETKDFTRWLVGELEDRLPQFAHDLKLNVTGCPNSCGQHWIADIGIEGKKIRHEGRMQDAYYFCVGGGVGRFAAIARPVGYRCIAREVPDAIERLLLKYETWRFPGENLRRFFARHSDAQLREFLAGTTDVAFAARDVAAGPVPHGVEG
jgi:sulfite reductase (ferredoxin)